MWRSGLRTMGGSMTTEVVEEQWERENCEGGRGVILQQARWAVGA